MAYGKTLKTLYGKSLKRSYDGTVDSLYGQMLNEEGNNGQNYQTGAMAEEGQSFVKDYSNRLFGAPYQLLDSVDRRFQEINPNLGNEYLMNFMLNSPILHIRPGMPQYTGNIDKTSLSEIVKNIYTNTISKASNTPLMESVLNEAGSALIFGSGAKLQSRMFGFRETYYSYIQHVNYMCHAVATYMNLIDENGEYPNGCYTYGGTFETFDKIDWQDYRMASRGNNTPFDQLQRYAGAMIDNIPGFFHTVGGWITGVINGAGDLLAGEGWNAAKEEWNEATKQSAGSTILDQITSTVSAVEFMVEPISFTETLSNQTTNSFIEGMIDGVTKGVGTEIAWITNSSADVGIIESFADILGDSIESVSQVLGPLVQGVGGGFARNLFSGAVAALKGQKMIYPKIYDSSESTMDYQFSITLTTPYGDPYNFYMNIVVPLLHLIALVSPRMISANTVSSPFLVQAYIPGMCTCQLGIIRNMTIVKNPTTKHVSVNGYPLTVKVEFTIEELYNAMSISPSNDPASFLYNETLNDYLCNMAGLAPSVDTYVRQRNFNYQETERYFSQGLFAQDWLGGVNEKIVNHFVPNQFY